MGMIEKVEAAIRDNIQAALPDGVEVDYRYAAVAALQALLDPTDRMGLGLPDGYRPGSHSATQIYRAMIDAALKESEETR